MQVFFCNLHSLIFKAEFIGIFPYLKFISEPHLIPAG